MTWKETIVGIIVGAGFVTFFYFTGWKGMTGFLIGIGTCFYVVEVYRPMLNVIMDTVRGK